MSEMGGLRKYMPTTFWTFMIGSVALAGIFPLAGFWSKDEILLGASENGFPLMLVVGLIGAFMTAAYMTRACYLIFAGEYRGHGHPHESPPSMAWPLRILAVPAVLAGLLNAPGIELFHGWVEFEVEGVPEFLHHHEFNPGLAACSLAVGRARHRRRRRLLLPRRAPNGSVPTRLPRTGLQGAGQQVLPRRPVPGASSGASSTRSPGPRTG